MLQKYLKISRNMKVDLDSDYRIERVSSIEKEPQTLSFDQINYAREAALYVLNNCSIEEALRIFTEGLEPVLSIENCNMDMAMNSEEEGNAYDSVAVNHVLVGLRDIVTAPF